MIRPGRIPERDLSVHTGLVQAYDAISTLLGEDHPLDRITPLGARGTPSLGRRAGGRPLEARQARRQAGLLQVEIDQLREARAALRRDQSIGARFLRNVDDNRSLA